MVLYIVYDRCVMGIGSCGMEDFVGGREFRYVPNTSGTDFSVCKRVLLTIIVLSDPHFLSLGDRLGVDSNLDRSLLLRGREVPFVDLHVLWAVEDALSCPKS